MTRKDRELKRRQAEAFRDYWAESVAWWRGYVAEHGLSYLYDVQVSAGWSLRRALVEWKRCDREVKSCEEG